MKTSFAAALALPSTMPMDPARKTQFIPENEEQPIHPLYRYAYIADRDEGLVIVDVTTLTDGNPSNNFLSRALTFNPDNILDEASAITVAGRWLFVGAAEGLVVIDIDRPWVIEAAKMEASAGNTPFDRQPTQGRVIALYKGGMLV